MLERRGRGLFIVFEGVDRAGKSTQCEMLKNYFLDNKKQEVEKIGFPGHQKFKIRP